MSKGCCIISVVRSPQRVRRLSIRQWPKPELMFPLWQRCSPEINTDGQSYPRDLDQGKFQQVAHFLCASSALVLRATSAKLMLPLDKKSGSEPKLLTKTFRTRLCSCPIAECEQWRSEYLSYMQLVTLAVSGGIGFGFYEPRHGSTSSQGLSARRLF